jgi:hypothetical protein
MAKGYAISVKILAFYQDEATAKRESYLVNQKRNSIGSVSM